MPKLIDISIPNLKITQQEIQKYGDEAFPRIKYGFLQFLTFLADQARLRCPVKTGHLQSSIQGQISKETPGEIEGRVGTNIKYGPYVECGTGIYGPNKSMIVPKKKKVLVWVSTGPRPTTKAGWKQASAEGRVVVAKAVKGMPPRPYLLPAVLENLDKIVEFLKRYL